MNQYSQINYNLDADHPLRKASWIWPNGNLYLHNLFVDFRYDFELEIVPDTAPLFITADKSYRLYINGKYVCRGPARGYQSHWPFDEIEVRNYIRRGHNYFAIEAYNPGISTFQYIHHTKAGLLCAAEWGDVKIYSNDRDWLMRRCPAHKSDTARLTKQLDFQEWFDARLDDGSWITSEAPPVGWSAECARGFLSTSTPFGQPPYENVEPRGIPMLREEVVVPKNIMCHGFGECFGDYHNCQNIAWHFIDHEYPTVEKWLPGCEIDNSVDDAMAFAISPTGKENFHAVTVDLGKNIPGSLILEVDEADGTEIIDIHYHQLLRNGFPEFIAPGAGSLISLAGRLIPAAGNCYHEFHHIYGVKQFTLVIRNSKQPLKIKCSWRTALYPFTMQGEFSCSDHELNDIYDICQHTQEICSLDAYVDTPWREQAQWWGDARVQIQNTIYMDGDMRLAERGIRSIAGQHAPHELTFGHAPTCNGGCIIPDFSLTWILTIWDCYWQTGKLDIFYEQHERIRAILNYFKSSEACVQNGLLIYDRRFWLFEDWGTLPKEHIPTFLNLWHLYTLKHYAKLLEAAGMNGEAEIIRNDITSRQDLLIEHLFDSGSGLFVAALNESGEVVGEPSVHDQVLAIMLDLVPEARENMIKKRLLPCLRDDESLTCAMPSAFWSTYLIECMIEQGYGRETLEYIRRKWSPMIPTGSTWEVFDFGDYPGWSYTHAWSAHPAVHLVHILTGIKQTAPAWKEASWTPKTYNLSKVETIIPTPQGKLHISLNQADQKNKFIIDIPSGIKVDASIPHDKRKPLNEGRHEFKVMP